MHGLGFRPHDFACGQFGVRFKHAVQVRGRVVPSVFVHHLNDDSDRFAVHGNEAVAGYVLLPLGVAVVFFDLGGYGVAAVVHPQAGEYRADGTQAAFVLYAVAVAGVDEKGCLALLFVDDGQFQIFAAPVVVLADVQDGRFDDGFVFARLVDVAAALVVCDGVLFIEFVHLLFSVVMP